MFQGTNENAGVKKIQNGFGIGSTKDEGYYGKGIYFTSSMEYASRYSTKTTKGKVFILSLVISGNSFPIIEHPFKYIQNENGEIKKYKNEKGFLGQACRPGYQSHYTIVETKGTSIGYPTLKTQIDPNKTADELVIFEGNQILPLFLIYSNQFDCEGNEINRQDLVSGLNFVLFLFRIFIFYFSNRISILF